MDKNVILTYIKNLRKEYIYPYIKSVSYFASYKYDMYVIDASTEDNPEITNQIEAFGMKVIKRSAVYDNLFIDRLIAFKEFGLSHHYERILCMDFSDIYIQKNPFEILDKIPQDKLIVSSEGVVIGDQKWNYTVIGNVYGYGIADFLKPYEVLNCGVMCGSPTNYADLCDTVVAEYERFGDGVKSIYGVDQALILKLIYHDQKIKLTVIRDDYPFAAHLHVQFNEKEKCRFQDIQIFGGKSVKDKDNNLFSIVHQYNRSTEMYGAILNHFNMHYQPPN